MENQLTTSRLINDLLEQTRPFFTSIVMECLSAVHSQVNLGNQLPERINFAQAAELTGYSKNSLYQMHSKGKIPGAVKIGRKVMFETEILRNWRNSGGQH